MDTEALGMVPPNTTGTYQQVAELFAALAKAQGKFSPIVRNQTAKIKPGANAQDRTPYTFAYADMAEIISATRPALAENGLALVQPMVPLGGMLTLRTILCHAGGATMWTECQAPNMNDMDIKIFGGRLSYLRRYQMSGLLSVHAEDDIDSDGRDAGDGGGTAGEYGDEHGQPPAQPMQRAASAPGAKIDAGSLAWIGRKTKSLSMDQTMIDATAKRLNLPSDFAQLTQEQFVILRADLNKAGRPA